MDRVFLSTFFIYFSPVLECFSISLDRGLVWRVCKTCVKSKMVRFTVEEFSILGVFNVN